MDFIHCPFCNKFVVVSLLPEDAIQKTMCKKCYKVFYVHPTKKGILIYKEDEVIINPINHALILKKTIDKQMGKKIEDEFHKLNERMTENAAKEGEDGQKN